VDRPDLAREDYRFRPNLPMSADIARKGPFVLSETATQPTFTYQGQRFYWGYSLDRQLCGLWEVDDAGGPPHETWPIAEHEAAWRAFRSLEPFAACILPVDESPKDGTEQRAAPEVLADSTAVGKRKPRWRRLALIAAVSAVVVAGAVFAVTKFKSNSPVSPASAVLTAATTTQGLRSANMSMTETITGVPGSGTVTLTGSGKVDFVAHEASFTMNVEGEHLSVLSSDGNLFVSFPQISQLLPGKSWVSIPVGNTSSATGGAVSDSDPTQMLQFLASRGNAVSTLGSSTIDGVPVVGYFVLINKSATEARLSSAGLPSSVVQAAEHFLESTGPISYKVYVNSDNQLRAIDFSMPVSGVSGALLSTRMTLSEFGTPVSVITPPASEVASYEQFLYVDVASGNSASF
jgi:hypothetical protein